MTYYLYVYNFKSKFMGSLDIGLSTHTHAKQAHCEINPQHISASAETRWAFLLDYESPLFLRDSRASETQARVKSPHARLAFLAWSDFHARSRSARSIIPEGKWWLLVVYIFAII